MQWLSTVGSQAFSIMSNLVKLRLHLILFIIFMCCTGFTLGLSCKDENNNDVDWFINYKLPKISSEETGSDLQEGKAYAYITSEKVANWNLSSTSIESTNSMLGRTWQDLADNIENEDISYLIYNDDAPGDHGTAVGHLKGIVAFNDKTGFWLIHSIPNFGEIHTYEYPSTALTNGQTAICVTFDVSYLDEICNHLLYCNPNIYQKKLSASVSKFLEKDAKTLFTDRPAFVRKPPFLRKTILESLGHQTFYTFAKDNQLKEDIYSSIIAPSLKTSLLAETWRRGAGGNLLPTCKSNYSVVDITSINMKVSNKKEEISFKSTEDHSKWAISDESSSNWVCLGDLNRMKSQERRGGGAICFKSKQVWKAFESIISETSLCPTK